MNFLNKLERKFSKYAVSNLTMYLIFGYVIGYVLSRMAPGMLNYLTLDPYRVLHGQIWRLVTWVLIPPSAQSILFYVIMMLFYYQLGTSLERTWGVFRYNVYIFGGILYTVIGAFVTWMIMTAVYGNAGLTGAIVGVQVSTYYICMSIFLAFAACYPNMQILLYFIIPIKMKWMAYVYAVLMLLDLVQGSWPQRIVMMMSLLNFVIFFLSTRDLYRFSPKEVHRRQAYRQAVNRPQSAGITKHKCAVCGRTEKDDPSLEFRFCSKCAGNYEYCQEHLFTHQHVQ
ncbi:MAG: rhomboid family intramembrane serine protease [Eubacterium sp.]|nr:rhomboid family intramembrane serine protease [Eubacterium sp.]